MIKLTQLIEVRGLQIKNTMIEDLIEQIGFLSFNFSALASYKNNNPDADKELRNIISNLINAKVINGLTILQLKDKLVNDKSFLKNEDFIKKMLKWTYDYINYLRPRFTKFLTDEGKKKYIDIVLKNLEQKYISAVNFYKK